MMKIILFLLSLFIISGFVISGCAAPKASLPADVQKGIEMSQRAESIYFNGLKNSADAALKRASKYLILNDMFCYASRIYIRSYMMRDFNDSAMLNYADIYAKSGQCGEEQDIIDSLYDIKISKNSPEAVNILTKFRLSGNYSDLFRDVQGADISSYFKTSLLRFATEQAINDGEYQYGISFMIYAINLDKEAALPINIYKDLVLLRSIYYNTGEDYYGIDLRIKAIKEQLG